MDTVCNVLVSITLQQRSEGAGCQGTYLTACVRVAHITRVGHGEIRVQAEQGVASRWKGRVKGNSSGLSRAEWEGLKEGEGAKRKGTIRA